MYDDVRWIILGLLFAGLVGGWFWSRRHAQIRRKSPGAQLKVSQKKWLDKGTGLCLVEFEDERFLLAYTVGGGITWQPLEAREAPDTPEIDKPSARRFADALPELEIS
jgi:hypothetical protein